MQLNLYGTLLFDIPRNDFAGCNKSILDIVGSLDGQEIECREVGIIFKPEKIRVSAEVYCSYDDLGLGAKQLFDEDDLDNFFRDKVLDAGLTHLSNVLPNMIHSELSEKSPLDRAAEIAEEKAMYRVGIK